MCCLQEFPKLLLGHGGVVYEFSRHVCFEEILTGILDIGDFWQHVGCPKHLKCFLLFVSFRKSSLLGMANLLVQS